jgi:small subunit ribosomal protein S12
LATIAQRGLSDGLKRKLFSKTPRLSHSFNFYKKRPNLKGVVLKVSTMSPKKPNSANRHVCKITLTTLLYVTCRIPGKGNLCSKFNRVLVEGGRANDLPGISYTIKRGGYDFTPLFYKRKRRSIYGTPRSEGHSKHIKRKDRA